MANYVERLKIISVRTTVRSEGWSTYWLHPSSFLRKLFLRPSNLRMDMKDVGCDRLSRIILRSENEMLNDGSIRISAILLHLISVVYSSHHREAGYI